MTNSLLENTLARLGDLMASFTRPPSMFTCQCEGASGILHPCKTLWGKILIPDNASEIPYIRHLAF